MFHGQENNPGQHDDGREEAQDQIDQSGGEFVPIGIEDLLPEGIAAIEYPFAAMVKKPGTDQGDQGTEDIVCIHIVCSIGGRHPPLVGFKDRSRGSSRLDLWRQSGDRRSGNEALPGRALLGDVQGKVRRGRAARKRGLWRLAGAGGIAHHPDPGVGPQRPKAGTPWASPFSGAGSHPREAERCRHLADAPYAAFDPAPWMMTLAVFAASCVS